MKKACLVVLTILAVIFAYILIYCIPAPTPLSQQQKKELMEKIEKETEWSGHGDTIIATIPLIKISENPRIRIVRSTTWSKKGGYESESTSVYPEINFHWDMQKELFSRKLRR